MELRKRLSNAVKKENLMKTWIQRPAAVLLSAALVALAPEWGSYDILAMDGADPAPAHSLRTPERVHLPAHELRLAQTGGTEVSDLRVQGGPDRIDLIDPGRISLPSPSGVDGSEISNPGINTRGLAVTGDPDIGTGAPARVSSHPAINGENRGIPVLSETGDRRNGRLAAFQDLLLAAKANDGLQRLIDSVRESAGRNGVLLEQETTAPLSQRLEEGLRRRLQAMGLTLRLATNQDRHRLQDFVVGQRRRFNIQPDDVKTTENSKPMDGDLATTDAFNRRYDGASGQFLIVERNGSVASIGGWTGATGEEGTAEMVKFYTAESAGGHSIGTDLATLAIARALEDGYQRLVLYTRREFEVKKPGSRERNSRDYWRDNFGFQLFANSHPTDGTHYDMELLVH